MIGSEAYLVWYVGGGTEFLPYKLPAQHFLNRVKDKSFSKDGMNRSKMKVFAKNVNFAIFKCVDKVKTSCLKLMSKFSIFTLVSDNA